jgi:hypothetical protein
MIIAPRIARKWESEFILPPSKKHRILEANARDLIAYKLIANHQILWKDKRTKLIIVFINKSDETVILPEGFLLGHIEELDDEPIVTNNPQETAESYGVFI